MKAYMWDTRYSLSCDFVLSAIKVSIGQVQKTEASHQQGRNILVPYRTVPTRYRDDTLSKGFPDIRILVTLPTLSSFTNTSSSIIIYPSYPVQGLSTDRWPNQSNIYLLEFFLIQSNSNYFFTKSR